MNKLPQQKPPKNSVNSFFPPKPYFARKFFRKIVWGIPILFGISILAACSSEKSPTTPQAPACATGATLQCYCANDYYGVQICTEDGSAYSPCDCSDAPPPPEPPPEPPAPGPKDCDPPLALVPERSHVLPWQLNPIAATGGSGAYQFELTDNQSGGLVNALTGSYLAGGTGSAADTIQVTDGGCLGNASITVSIVSPMEVRPRETLLNPSVPVQMAVTLGSGDYAFEFSQNSTGGTLSESGLYTAGAEIGTDIILVHDTETEEEALSTFTTITGASLFAESNHLVIPTGHSHGIEIHGGSGHATITASLPGLNWADDTITATQAGTTTATLTDNFTAEETTFTVTVVDSLQMLAVHSGDHLSFASSVPAGDINQDGFPDAILGVSEASINGHQSGGVFIYEGTSVGLNIAPIRVISGEIRSNRLGSQLQIADVNNDGLSDLIVSAYRAHVNANYGGAVYIYHGISNGYFETTPSITLAQSTTYAEFGYALTTCDFDGDSNLDLAVASRSFEDRDVDELTSNQGAVFIYLGTGSGLSVQPKQIVYGKALNDSNQWEYSPQMKLGKSLAAGHLNDDSYCDLVVGANAPLLSDGDDGAVLIYSGKPGTDLTVGGVEDSPALAYRRMDSQSKSQVGRSIAVANINGDDFDDILIGEPYYNGAFDNIGAAYIVLGDLDLSTVATSWTSIESLTPHFLGDSKNDAEGWMVSAADHNNDGIEDFVLGSLAGEATGGPNNSGTLRIFFGVQDSLPSQTPDLELTGTHSGDRFGFTSSALGDLNADGNMDYLSFSQFHDDMGFDVGLPFFVSAAPTPTYTALEFPTQPAGQLFGKATSFVKNPSNDGSWLVAVGANLQDEAAGYNRGAVYLYDVDADGATNTTATQILNQYPRRANSDQFGYDVVGLNDFNGDGRADIAVVAYQHHRKNIRSDSGYIGPANNWNSAPTECNDADISDTGAVFIYLGQSDGTFYSTPEFVFFGPEKNQKIKLASTGDINGDGLSDVVFASNLWDSGNNNAGGIAVVFGRSNSANTGQKAEVICETDFLFHGFSNNDGLGYSLAALGDINEDGCDEFAAGAKESDQEQTNGGEIRIFWGWEGTNCPADTTVTSLASGIRTSKAGSAIAGGHDIDGDSIPDVVVGGEEFESTDGTDTGIVWLLSGNYLKDLASQTATQASSNPTFHSFGVALSNPKLQIQGSDLEERFGAALSMVPNLESDGRAGILVGHPGSWELDYAEAGGASLYRFELANGGAFSAHPFLHLSGETSNWGAELGLVVSAVNHPTNPLIAVGGYWGQGSGLDRGSAYIISVALPE